MSSSDLEKFFIPLLLLWHKSYFHTQYSRNQIFFDFKSFVGNSQPENFSSNCRIDEAGLLAYA